MFGGGCTNISEHCKTISLHAVWFLFSSQQSLPNSLWSDSFSPSAQKPIVRTQSPSDPHHPVFKINFSFILPLTLYVQKLCNHISRLSHACSHPSHLTFFFFSFSHASIDHSSTQDLWAEVVSILPTHLAVSSVQCGFYWRVRGRSVSHARRQLTHPIATSSLTPSTALPCGLKMRQCCSPTDDFETEGGPRGVRSDTDPNLVQWNCAALSNKTKRPLHVTFADVCCSSASWANDALCVFHPERKTY